MNKGHLGIILAICIGCGSIHAEELLSQPKFPRLVEEIGGQQPYAEITYMQAGATVNLQTGKANRTFILLASVYVPDSIEAVGISHQVEITELIDDQDRDLLNDKDNAKQIVFVGQRHYSSLSRHQRDGINSPISVNTSLHGLARIPNGFETIRGRSWLMLATRRLEHVITPIEEGGFVELTPTLMVQIVNLKREGQSVQIQFRYDAEAPGPFLDPNTPPPFVEKVILVDDAGHEVIGRGGAPNSPGPDDGIFRGEGRFSFTLDSERKPVALKFEVITETEEREVEFVAHGVKLPIVP